MELIVKNMPSLKERIDSYHSTDALAFGDQVHRRQPFSPVPYDLQNSMDNLKRQRSVPNVQGNQRQWRQRRFSDHRFDENQNWHRNNTQNPRDINNRNKWTIVSPDMFLHKPTNQSTFRKPETCQEKPDNQNRYRPKETVSERSAFSDNDKIAKWKYHSMYPPTESEQDLGYKIQGDGSQDDLVQHNRMVSLSQIEPRCIQKHSDQQPVDLDALFQGYRVANENPKNPGDRQMYKGPQNQGQMRYGCKTNAQNRGRRWYNNFNFCPPPWVMNAVYDQDDPHDGVYMKPGSYDVPKREQKPVSRQFATAPQLPPPSLPVMTPPGPRFKAVQTEDVTWQAALASAETFCKSLRSNENFSSQSDAQQQWMMQKSHSSESDEVAAQPHPVDDTKAVITDVASNKSAVKQSNCSRPSSIIAGESPPPALPSSPPSSPPLTNPPPSMSPSSQPSSCRRSLSPSATQKIRMFLETVWAVNEANHIKSSPRQVGFRYSSGT